MFDYSFSRFMNHFWAKGQVNYGLLILSIYFIHKDGDVNFTRITDLGLQGQRSFFNRIMYEVLARIKVLYHEAKGIKFYQDKGFSCTWDMFDQENVDQNKDLY